MTNEVKDAPTTEVAPKVEEVKVSDIIRTDDKTEKRDNSVPEAVFLEIKKEKKALEKELKALKTRIEDGETAKEISDDVDSIAEEYGVDKTFLKKFSKTTKDDISKEVEKLIKPFKDKEMGEVINGKFNSHFEKVIEEMPEYKDIVNKNVIKTLSLIPENADKTFQQLIQETYGNSIRGKRTLEQTTPHGGKEPDNLDFDKARRDSEYFKEVMKTPSLKAEYNSKMLSRGF